LGKRHAFKPFLQGGIAWQVLLGSITLAAIALTLDVKSRSLGFRYEFPQMSMREPIRALFWKAEEARRGAQAPRRSLRGWWTFGECDLCTEAKVDRAFDELVDERDRYRDRGHHRKTGSQWLEEEHAARLVALAGWGGASRLADLKATARDRFPDYAEERVRELLSGGAGPERERIAQAGRLGFGWWSRTLLMLFALASAIAWKAGVRYPRRQARCQLKAPDFWRGIVIFAWTEGFSSALTLLRWDDPDGILGALAQVQSLLPAIAAAWLLVGTRTERDEKPVAKLVACPPDMRSRRVMIALALAAIGTSYVFWRGSWPVMHHFGLAPAWAEGLRENQLFGSSSEAAASFINDAVFAAVGEELLYRGVLFGCLTRRMSVHRAALLSSAVFAAVHGYGLLGSADIMLSGYIWARLDARTGTLAPSLIAHSWINFLLGLGRLLAR
jgi:membrane protease YdiL (CAAX protease family)